MAPPSERMATLAILAALSHLAAFCIIISPSAHALHFDENTNTIFPSSSEAHLLRGKNDVKVYYQTGTSDADLPVCSPNSVCNKIDTYGTPWVEKQCRCPSGHQCSTSTHPKDGRTVVDRTRLYKTCEPVRKLKRCKYFRDVTWTYITYPDNSTQQVMHCRCPKNSVAYLIKRHAYQTPEGGTGFQYSFACSPQTKIRCQRKEPCRLFSVRKNLSRPSADEVSMSSLCQCPKKSRCPKHHLDVGVIPGKVYTDTTVRTYSGYCM